MYYVDTLTVSLIDNYKRSCLVHKLVNYSNKKFVELNPEEHPLTFFMCKRTFTRPVLWCGFTVRFYLFLLNFKSLLKVPYFIEYSAHFFTLKMMLKYSLFNYTWKEAKKGLRWLLW
jgi:hypothetical protein